MTMDQCKRLQFWCILLLIALVCVNASEDAWRPTSTGESSPPLLRSLLMSSSIVNEINHNHNRNHNRNGSSININALSTQSERSEDDPISEPVSQSQYYYYQQRLFRPNVNLRISSEYGIVRRHQLPLPTNKDKDDYFVYTTGTAVGASASPNSIIDSDSDGKDKGKAIAKGGYSEKVIIEPQQSTLESPIEQEQLQYHRFTDPIHLQMPPVAESDSGHHPSDSLNPRPESHRPRVRVSYEHVDVDPSSSASASASASASSSSLVDADVDVDTSNSNADKDKGGGGHTVSVTDKSEKLNAIVVNEPPSGPAPGSTNVDYDDDYSNYYHYDEDYQQQQYSHSFPDYTDEELLENVADTAEIHNQYFVKTKPRDVITQIETSLSPLALPEDGLDGHSYNAYLHASLNETGARTTGTTPTTMQEQDSSDFYENMPFPINKAPSAAAAADNKPHSMKLEIFPSGPTMASISAQEESTKMLDDAEYGLMMTPTIASNLIADVTRKFGSTDSTSIPGMPGIDYPILDEIPQTSFDCQKQRYKGFFADVETKCQAWHYCDFIDGHSTFLCPNGTLFSQTLLTCDWWFKVRCEESQQLYVLNERLYRYIKAPKLSFPEDFHGPHVDDFLLEQLQLGLLPKIKKKVKDKVVIQEKYS